MFLRSKTRRKDGKEHRYWSMVENRRVADGRVVQRHVLYLGEINDTQRAAWCRTIAVFDEETGTATQLALFPEDRPAPDLACAVVQVQSVPTATAPPTAMGGLLAGVRAVGRCCNWTTFWQPRLPPSRKGTRWLNVLKTLVATA